MVQIENSIRPCYNILDGECAGIKCRLTKLIVVNT